MPKREEHRVAEVYGVVRRGVPLTYVSRPKVDDRFLNEITRDQHIVIYGTSKQGKSSLIITALEDADYVAIQCATNWSKRDLYAAVLKELDVALIESTTRSTARSSELSAQAGVEGGTSWIAKVTGSAGAKAGRTNTDSQVEKTIPINLDSGLDIIRVLEGMDFDRFIVVEDFHYLPLSVQREFASDLKAFYERSKVSFILVGVWLEANRLIVYNGDLAGRITSIPADTWTSEELARVVRSGEPYLNIKFADAVVNELVKRSQQNVGLLQEALRQMCIGRDIFSTVETTATFEDLAEVETAYAYVAEQLATRYANFINKFSEGLRDQVLHMYKWVMHAVISTSAEDRRAGLKAMDIVRHVQQVHPRRDGVYQNSVMAALDNVAKVQSHADITPVIFDYDNTHKRLNIVDNGFLIYLDSTPAEEALGFLASFSNEEAPNTPS